MARVPKRQTWVVDMSSITKSLDNLATIPARISGDVSDLIAEAGRNILLELFESAMNEETQDAFPEKFREHIREVINANDFKSTYTTTGIKVSFDFNDLGTTKDLQRAFHQGAQLADGSKLDGPYEGQTLKNPDARERHIYWQAVRERKEKAQNPKDPSKSIRVDPGAWDETIEKYISIWGDKAPQWLYLNFGQSQWDPKIGKHDLVERFETMWQLAADEIWTKELDKYFKSL